MIFLASSYFRLFCTVCHYCLQMRQTVGDDSSLNSRRYMSKKIMQSKHSIMSWTVSRYVLSRILSELFSSAKGGLCPFYVSPSWGKRLHQHSSPQSHPVTQPLPGLMLPRGHYARHSWRLVQGLIMTPFLLLKELS